MSAPERPIRHSLEMIRRVAGATRAGGDNGGKTHVVPAIAAGLVLVMLVLGTRFVPAGHAGLVERSGSYRRTLRRRVGWVVPFVEHLRLVELLPHELVLGAEPFRSGDEVQRAGSPGEGDCASRASASRCARTCEVEGAWSVAASMHVAGRRTGARSVGCATTGTRSLNRGHASGFSRSPKKASTRSTAPCCRWAVSVEWPRPSSSTRTNLSPSSRVRVSKRVPVAGSLR